MLCPVGHETAAGSPYCSTCGQTVVPPATRDVRCVNGHDIPVGNTFCRLCGLPAATRLANDRHTDARSLSSRVRRGVAWVRRLRWDFKLMLALAVALAIWVPVLAMLRSDEKSLSYRDGYVIGDQSAPTSITTANSDCDLLWVSSTASLGTDNEGQWFQGCVDGYNHAMYLSNHPGAG
jgi:hypothetical protein